MHDPSQLRAFARELSIDPEGQDEPAIRLLDAAMWTVPTVINDVDEDQYVPTENSASHVVTARQLVSHAQGRGHSESVARWAVYRLIQNDCLGVEVAAIRFPKSSNSMSTRSDASVLDVDGDSGAGVSEKVTLYHVPPSSAPGRAVKADSGNLEPDQDCDEMRYLVVWPTSQLWFWWRDLLGAMIESQTDDVGYLRWPGGRFDLRGVTWRLLKFLWNKPETTFEDVGEVVWDDADAPATKIRSQVSRLNDHLASHGLNITWETTARRVSLVVVERPR